MPKTGSSDGDWPLLAALGNLDPPKGWLTVANEAKDLVALADATRLSAAITSGQYKLKQLDYDTANALWQEKVIAPCANPSDGIRTVREHADAIP